MQNRSEASSHSLIRISISFIDLHLIMTIEVRKKTDESVEGMIRRFTKRVVQSGIVWRAKKKRFYESPQSKSELRKAAQHRRKTAAKYDYLRKIGKLDEIEERGRGRGKRKSSLRRS